VWIRDVQKPEVLSCVGLWDFYTLDNLIHAKFFLENSIASIKKLLLLCPFPANAKQARI
jgi:hypothetical protein